MVLRFINVDLFFEPSCPWLVVLFVFSDPFCFHWVGLNPIKKIHSLEKIVVMETTGRYDNKDKRRPTRITIPERCRYIVYQMSYKRNIFLAFISHEKSFFK